MLIKNARVYSEKNTFEDLDVRIQKDRITQVAKDLIADDKEEILDAKGQLLLPGLVDIHFHGAVGHDFCDGDYEGLRAIAAYEASKGILAICPATMTYSEEILGHIMDVACQFKKDQVEAENSEWSQLANQQTSSLDSSQKADYQFGSLTSSKPTGHQLASLVGINMEGPFISPQKIGAQNPTYLQQPDVEMFRRLQQRSGNLIKLVDIAPEIDGAMDFIEKCKDDVTISIAHTCTDYKTAMLAFEKGASHMTHLFNAMPDIGHREPGPIIAGIESGAEAEIIADNIHVHPAMVRFAFRDFGRDRMILIADSMEATGLLDGQYQLGGQAVTKTGNLAVLTEHPETIAGSVTDLFDCMKTAVTVMGVPLDQAIQASTINPARSIGIEKDYGSIAEGKYANLILMEADFTIQQVINKGKKIV